MSLHRVIKSMGTVVTFDVVDDLDPAALEPALDWLVWMEDTFSTFRPTSEVSRIQRGELDPAKSHPLVQEVLDSCDDLFVRSNGVFDPLESLGEIEHQYEVSEDRAVLAPGFRILDERERTILHLRFFEGLTQSQIIE